jgi:hypothetical protein
MKMHSGTPWLLLGFREEPVKLRFQAERAQRTLFATSIRHALSKMAYN